MDAKLLAVKLVPAPRFLPKLSLAIYGYWTRPSGRQKKLCSNMYCVLSCLYEFVVQVGIPNSCSNFGRNNYCFSPAKLRGREVDIESSNRVNHLVLPGCEMEEEWRLSITLFSAEVTKTTVILDRHLPEVPSYKMSNSNLLSNWHWGSPRLPFTGH